jgi:DNA-binding transcriptional LysR family regulator
MGDVKLGTGGHLRLWANTSAFGGFLPRLLARYAQAHPGVVFDLEDAISEDAVRAVARGTAELGVVGENTPSEGLQTLVCHVDELVLMLPASHALVAGARDGTPTSQMPAVALHTLLDHDLVAFGRSTSLTRQLAAAAEAAHRPLRIRAQVRSFDAMARMVSAGLGLAVLPREGAQPYVHALGMVLAPISGMRCERRLLLAMRERDGLTPAAQAFVRMAVPASPAG